MLENQILSELKEFLDIPDSSKDSLLSMIIRNSMTGMKFKLKGSDVPQELAFIVLELSIQRYNRLGTEGLKSETIDVIRQDFSEDEWLPFLHYIDDYLTQEGKKKSIGRVRFL